ncbi:MAG: hypothetical protein E7189_03030 [Erysipelotrichaceae bacterium]|uniref:PTS system IIA component n=1 Tax=Faecalicoccus pleomorphus TaxID=1323 RepID=A0A380LQV8_9FIRM|nr:hypothetical protein [Faecalicoccus pleomorphus]MBE6119400.1 hypothetical protein [Erysipelotrichaceae bacterium]SUO04960.1 PTS system IIA component [Faecalicoccus pleomorphus]
MGDAFEVLVVTHAALSKGYFSALQLILDIDQNDMDVLSFETGEALDTFSNKISDVVENKYKDKNMVILLDLPGGTPANMALPFLSDSRKLIAGINLPLVLELMIAKKNGVSWEELDLETIIENARTSIIFYNKLLKTEDKK